MGKLIVLLALAAIVVMWWRGATTRKRVSMPVSEARALLGVGESADGEEIRAAHRRIIVKVHPDSGGTPDLARRTNLARDVLLAELRRTSRD